MIPPALLVSAVWWLTASVNVAAHGQMEGDREVTFSAEVDSASTMRKTTEEMVFDPSNTGPTLLSWKAARDLKLGTSSRGVFHPAHTAQLVHKRRGVPLDRYPGAGLLFPVGPPSYLKSGTKGRPFIDVYVFRPEKEFRLSGTDGRGKRRTARLREICVPADSRLASLPRSIAGPDFVDRFDAAIAGVGPSAIVLWDQRAPKRGGRTPFRLHK